MPNIKRTVGRLTYELTRKKVKNINLRLGEDLSIRVSANPRVPLSFIDAFVQSKEGWILEKQAKMKSQTKATGERERLIEAYTNEECLEFFERVSDKFFPLFAHVLDEKPEIKVRLMKSRWGVCHVDKGRIVLNKLLILKPLEQVEYVILHEYVHFIHPNHQKGFHELMHYHMPDYKERKRKLTEN